MITSYFQVRPTEDVTPDYGDIALLMETLMGNDDGGWVRVRNTW